MQTRTEKIIELMMEIENKEKYLFNGLNRVDFYYRPVSKAKQELKKILGK